MNLLKNLNISNINQLNGFHNEVFSAMHFEDEIVIRVTKRRSKLDLLSEINVLNSIKDEVKVVKPYKIDNEYFLEENDKIYVFFEKLKLKNWYETKLSNQTHYNAGRELAKLHHSLLKLKDVNRSNYKFHPDLTLLDSSEELIKKELDRVLKQIDHWDKNTIEYGLIHGDYLYSNLMYNSEEVTIIDFDDLEYNFYLYDISVYLFYLLLGGNPAKIDIEPNVEVFKYFISGYQSINNLIKLDFSKIQTLFRLRQLKLFATISSLHNELLGEWQKAFIKLTIEQINSKRDFVEIDYPRVYKELCI